MSMKYVVVRRPHHPKQLFMFPAVTSHVQMASMLKHHFGNEMEVVSAGQAVNYREKMELKDGTEHEFDNVQLSGESITLNVRSKPEDVELFRAESGGW